MAISHTGYILSAMNQPHPHTACCRHAQDHQHHAADALKRAEQRCQDSGLRLTPIRRDVLEVLCADHRPLGAYDLVEGLSRLKARRIAPISVYRALDFLVEQGLVHRLSTRNAYIACTHSHGAGETVAFLICEKCGGVDEDCSPGIRTTLSAITSGIGFEAHHQMIEITGLCEHCR